MNVLFTLTVKLKVSLCLNKLHVYLTSGIDCLVSFTSRPLYLWEIVVSAGWELTFSAFPTAQVLKEYCQAETMSAVTGVIRCTAVENKQQNLLC